MVRVRKKRPRVVVVQQRNRLDALPAVYPTQFGGRDSLSGLPPPVVHPAVVKPGLSSTAFQPRTAYLPAAGPAAAVYQNPGYRPRLGSSGRRSGVPLPKCSYINTDFPGDDLYLDGATSAGLNAGSARACKARCKLEELCNFWTYREGDNRDTLTRDCFLKEGTPGECHFLNIFTHNYSNTIGSELCCERGNAFLLNSLRLRATLSPSNRGLRPFSMKLKMCPPLRTLSTAVNWLGLEMNR